MSEATAEATTEAAETTETVTEQAVDYEAEAKKWQALARKHEERAKANANAAKELEEVRKASMTEQEKAVEAAKVEARAQAFAEAATRLVDAEFKAAAAGRLSDEQRTSLLENLDRKRFLTDDGEVDAEKVAAFVAGIAPAEQASTLPDLGQGVRPAALALNGDPLLQTVNSLLGNR